MSEADNRDTIESYKFHHIDVSKCRQCKEFSCEDACFRGIYEVINKESIPKCIVVEALEDSIEITSNVMSENPHHSLANDNDKTNT